MPHQKIRSKKKILMIDQEETTIVSCLYDIRSRESSMIEDEGETIKTIDDYLEHGRHMLSVPFPMVIYTDSQYIFKEVQQHRSELGLAEKTRIVLLPLEETFFYPYQDRLRQLQLCTEFKIHNLSPKKDTPLYVIVNNNKFDLLDRTLTDNPFSTNFFLWMDFGIQHCAHSTPEEWQAIARDWPPILTANSSQIHQLCIHAVARPPSMSWREYFQIIYHHRAGGLFGGHRTPLLEYIRLFKHKWDQILNEGWWQLDEAIMTIITEEHPTMFRFWYGDYDGLISNFVHSQRSWRCVFAMIQHHLQSADYEKSEQILQTLDPVMTARTDRSDPDFLRYLALRVWSDYYQWDGRFSSVLESILEEPALIPTEWLLAQSNNLRFYKQCRTFFLRWATIHPGNQGAVRSITHSTREETEWVGWSKRAADVLRACELSHHAYPLDDMMESSTTWATIYEMLREQFEERTDEEAVRNLYRLLELGGKKVFFLVIADPATTIKKSIEEEMLAESIQYLRRCYPRLDIQMVCLHMNPTVNIVPRTEMRMCSLFSPNNVPEDEMIQAWLRQLTTRSDD